jgi:PilZ domain
MADEPYDVRRANPRFPFFADAEAILLDGTRVPAQIDELSADGCYIRTVEPIPIHTKLRLCIEHDRRPCELEGKVVYTQSGGGLGLFAAGVLFEDVSVEQRAAINAWLNTVAKRRRATLEKNSLPQIK